MALNAFEESPLFSELDRAAIAYAAEITANSRQMRPAVKARLKAQMSDPEIVDLTLACCLFNFMNRYSHCLEIDLDSDVPEELVRLMEATPAGLDFMPANAPTCPS